MHHPDFVGSCVENFIGFKKTSLSSLVCQCVYMYILNNGVNDDVYEGHPIKNETFFIV